MQASPGERPRLTSAAAEGDEAHIRALRLKPDALGISYGRLSYRASIFACDMLMPSALTFTRPPIARNAGETNIVNDWLAPSAAISYVTKW